MTLTGCGKRSWRRRLAGCHEGVLALAAVGGNGKTSIEPFWFGEQVSFNARDKQNRPVTDRPLGIDIFRKRVAPRTEIHFELTNRPGARWRPAAGSPELRIRLQDSDSLLHIERPDVLLDDLRHAHL